MTKVSLRETAWRGHSLAVVHCVTLASVARRAPRSEWVQVRIVDMCGTVRNNAALELGRQYRYVVLFRLILPMLLSPSQRTDHAGTFAIKPHGPALVRPD